MGVDIHTYIVKDNKILFEDFYDGRNYDFFGGLQRGEDLKHRTEYLNIQFGSSPQAPKELIETAKDWGYNFRYIKVADYLAWYYQYEPYRQAGWLTTLEAWNHRIFKIQPSYPKDYLDADDVINDYVFCEWNEDDPYKEIETFLRKNKVDPDADFYYFFDC